MIALASMLNLNKNQVVAFDLPAGYTCPMADKCKSYANRKTGKITDGKNMKFRCYASSGEARFSATRNAHWHNFEILRNSDNMVSEIETSLPKNVKVIRIHSSGDFYSMDYFNAWVSVAKNHPEIQFFGYTKVLPLVNAPKPDNFKLVYSHGGKMDNMVKSEPVAYVVNTVADGVARGLPVACQVLPSDDFYHIMLGQTFALALHGTQPPKKK